MTAVRSRIAGPLVTVALPIVATLVYISAVVLIAWAARATLGYDYVAYLHAGQRLLAGAPLYDPSVDVAGPFAIYLYPPPFALAMIQFTWLPAAAGPAIWTAILATAQAVGTALLPVSRSVRWTTLMLAGLCWPFLYSIKLGQVGPLLFLTFAAGWRWRDRPSVLGTTTAVGALIKVQPALLLGWAFFTGRHRAVVIGIAIAVVAALVATLVAGIGTWSDYVAILGRVSAPVTTPHNFTPGAIAYDAGVPLALATAIQWVSIAAAAVVILYGWLRSDHVSGYVTTVIGSQVVSPLLWEHYAMLLLIPVALLLERRHWWAIALPLLPWLGPLAYPPALLVGLVAPLLTGRRRNPGAAARPVAAQPAPLG